MSAERKYDYNYQEQILKKTREKTYEATRLIPEIHELSDKKKRRTIFQVMLVGVLLIMFVAGAAYASSLAYHNNMLVEENEAINANIQELKVEIQSTMNVGMVEKHALKELGMVYPTESQIVQLDNSENMNNFAEALRKEAFK